MKVKNLKNLTEGYKVNFDKAISEEADVCCSGGLCH